MGAKFCRPVEPVASCISSDSEGLTSRHVALYINQIAPAGSCGCHVRIPIPVARNRAALPLPNHPLTSAFLISPWLRCNRYEASIVGEKDHLAFKIYRTSQRTTRAHWKVSSAWVRMRSSYPAKTDIDKLWSPSRKHHTTQVSANRVNSYCSHTVCQTVDMLVLAWTTRGGGWDPTVNMSTTSHFPTCAPAKPASFAFS